MVLPGDGAARSARAADTEPSRWIVTGKPDPRTAAIARRHGARLLMRGTGMYEIRTARARRFAAALQRSRRLVFAEPNSRARPDSFPFDPFTARYQWVNLRQVVGPLTPPRVTARSPMLGIVDSPIDATHHEIANNPNMIVRRFGRGTFHPDGHGTAVTSLAAAPADGRGMVGVWPGMRVFGAGAGGDFECSALIEAIGGVVRSGARVLNASYHFPRSACFGHDVATTKAFAAGLLVFGSAGNLAQFGNPPDLRPSSDPHVLTVGAFDARTRAPAPFSNHNPGVDLAAPGVNNMAAMDLRFDDWDGTRDGYIVASGSSGSAPMAAAAATWVLNERPELTGAQLGDVLRASATDIHTPGYDEFSGHGAVNLVGALRTPAPPTDPLEVNDDIDWINGRLLRGTRAAPIFRGGRRAHALRGSVHSVDDPADVYIVRVPRRSSIRFRLGQRSGDPDLALYSRRARTVFAPSGNRLTARRRIVRSLKRGRRQEVVTLTNRSRRRRLVYVVVRGARSSAGASYRLKVGPVRYRPRARRVP
jgi:hypothetical protein